jgi:predicted dehydrogenase
VPALIHSDRVELVAVCDKEPLRRDEFLRKFSSEWKDRFGTEIARVPFYTDFRDLFNRENQNDRSLDFVVAVVPHDVYGGIIALAAGCHVHVLKEKPFARNLEEAKQFKALADDGRIRIMTAFQRRFHPIYTAFAQTVESLGRIHHVALQYTLGYGNRDWRADVTKAGGGVVLDMGYHAIDLVNWFIDPPTSVYARLTQREFLADRIPEDTAHISWSRESLEKDKTSDVRGTILISCVFPENRDEVIVLGEFGSARLERGTNADNALGERIRMERRTRWNDRVDVLESPRNWNPAMINQIDHFVRAIEDSTFEMKSSPDYQLPNHVRFIEACYVSQREKRVVSISEFS